MQMIANWRLLWLKHRQDIGKNSRACKSEIRDKSDITFRMSMQKGIQSIDLLEPKGSTTLFCCLLVRRNGIRSVIRKTSICKGFRNLHQLFAIALDAH